MEDAELFLFFEYFLPKRKRIFIRFLRVHYYAIHVSKRLGLLLNDDVSLIEPTIIETEKVLNGLIQSLQVG